MNSDTDFEVRPDTAIMQLKSGEPVFPKNKYWYIEFKLSLQNIDKFIPPVIIEQIINGDTHLMLCNSHEAFHMVVQEIYQHVILGMGIPEHKVILLSESADINQEIDRVAKATGREQISSVWTRIFEHGCMRHIEDRESASIQTPTLVDKVYDKKFLNFNRRWRPHRPTLVALMYVRDILSRGHVSLAPCDDHTDWPGLWEFIIHCHRDNGKITDMLTTNKESILKIPPMYLDTDELITNRALLEPRTDYLYADTYFSVVSETNFYDSTPGRFLSEKIFKPVVMGHPFIMVSRPNSLQLLRTLSYRTFSPWIDERYDQEEDDSKRLLMVLDEIERLSNLTPTEITEFLSGVRDTCLFNYRILKSKRTFYTFLPKCL